MSAFGPKQKQASALHMSAFGGKADMTVCGNSLSWSLLGVKRTWLVAPHMSANDPRRTLARHDQGGQKGEAISVIAIISVFIISGLIW
jgi:hypothetical protein